MALQTTQAGEQTGEHFWLNWVLANAVGFGEGASSAVQGAILWPLIGTPSKNMVVLVSMVLSWVSATFGAVAIGVAQRFFLWRSLVTFFRCGARRRTGLYGGRVLFASCRSPDMRHGDLLCSPLHKSRVLEWFAKTGRLASLDDIDVLQIYSLLYSTRLLPGGSGISLLSLCFNCIF